MFSVLLCTITSYIDSPVNVPSSPTPNNTYLSCRYKVIPYSRHPVDSSDKKDPLVYSSDDRQVMRLCVEMVYDYERYDCDCYEFECYDCDCYEFEYYDYECCDYVC